MPESLQSCGMQGRGVTVDLGEMDVARVIRPTVRGDLTVQKVIGSQPSSHRWPPTARGGGTAGGSPHSRRRMSTKDH